MVVLELMLELMKASAIKSVWLFVTGRWGASCQVSEFLFLSLLCFFLMQNQSGCKVRK